MADDDTTLEDDTVDGDTPDAPASPSVPPIVRRVGDQVPDAVPDDATTSPSAPPTVRRVGEWHLVTAYDYQVSVGPDALIMLPRHIHPRDVPDFVAAITVAADVANDVYTGNVEGGKDDERALAQRNAFVRQGGAPEGTVRMKVAQRQSEQATIGRPTRRGRGAASAQPVKSTPVAPSARQLRRSGQAADQ